ncbi:hypothetical protein L1887_16270 [Cichorium endivia]|nr:hypothetical protein L1887_16270 [Cichorium endivia]
MCITILRAKKKDWRKVENPHGHRPRDSIFGATFSSLVTFVRVKVMRFLRKLEAEICAHKWGLFYIISSNFTEADLVYLLASIKSHNLCTAQAPEVLTPATVVPSATAGRLHSPETVTTTLQLNFDIAEEKTRVEAFRDGHTDKEGKFDSPVTEQQHRDLQRAYEECTQTPPDHIGIFEKVLGARRGHVKGVGRKPSLKGSTCFEEGQSSQTQTQSKEKNKFEKLLENPAFRARLVKMMEESFNAEEDDGGNNGDGGQDGDGGTDEE